MSDYKRLTTKCEVGIGLIETSVNIVNDYEKVVNRLAELEDKIENGTFIELPCIREVNAAIAKYEVVYINKKNLIQSTLVCTKEDGWQIVSLFGNDYCKAEAKKKFKELKGGV